MKKIVILHTAHWQQAMGGAELQIKFLIEMLISENFKVYYIYEDKKTHFVNYHKLELRPIQSKIKSKRFGDRWVSLKDEVFTYLNEIKPDGIYTRTFSSWSGFATKYAVKNNIPHIWAVASDTDLPKIAHKASLLKPRDITARRLMNFTVDNCSHILVQNSQQLNKLKELYKRDGLLINQSSKKIEDVSLLNKSDKVLDVIWVANLKTIKQPELYLDIVKAYANDSRINFTMVGRSSNYYKEKIKELNSISNFKFLGELKNEEVNALLLKTHILINTSLAEGFSNTFVQGWLRKVVVLSMNSNPNGTLTEQNIGFVENDLDKIITRVGLLMENKKDLMIMADKAYYYALEHHDIDTNLNKIIAFFK